MPAFANSFETANNSAVFYSFGATITTANYAADCAANNDSVFRAQSSANCPALYATF